MSRWKSILVTLQKVLGLTNRNSDKDYYIKRSYILLKSDSSDDFLVSKKVYDAATNVNGEVDMMCEDVFAAVSSHRLLKGHSGARITWESVKTS